MSEPPNEQEKPPVFEQPVGMWHRLIYLASGSPWWAIFLILGIVALAYSMYSDPTKRDVLSFLADRPAVTTDEKYDVTYDIKLDVLLVQETVRVKDPNDFNPIPGRITILGEDVVVREENAIWQCPENAPEDCLEQRGTVITYRDYDVPAGQEPDDYVTLEGLVIPDTENVFGMDVKLPNGEIVSIFTTWITDEREGTLACNRLIDPDCETLVGRLVTFERSYIASQALEVRSDALIRYTEDGYEDEIRSFFIEERREEMLACEEGAPPDCEALPITVVTITEKITGVEIGGTDDYVEVRTVEQQTVEVARDQIISMETGLVECDQDADSRCQDFEGTLVRVKGEVLAGHLTLENATHYYVQFAGREEPIRYNRQDIVSEERSPEQCEATDQDPPCQITLTLEERTIGGRIRDTDTGIVIETVPEKIIRINHDDIVNTSRRVPASCALNNLRACNEGIWLTWFVTLVAYSFALVIGLVFGIMRVSSNPIFYHLSTVYVELVRGIPLLVILLYSAFVIAPTIRDAGGIIGDTWESLNSIEKQILGTDLFLIEALLGLSIGYGAFLSEVFRAGIQSISRGQMEAARSLGMNYFQAMRYIILPQAVRVVLPPLGNNFIAMLKDTSLIAILALPELLQRGRFYASATFQVILVYTAVALYYVIMTLVLSMLVRLIERWSRLP